MKPDVEGNRRNTGGVSLFLQYLHQRMMYLSTIVRIAMEREIITGVGRWKFPSQNLRVRNWCKQLHQFLLREKNNFNG